MNYELNPNIVIREIYEIFITSVIVNITINNSKPLTKNIPLSPQI